LQTENPRFSPKSYFDGTFDEQCNQYSECSLLQSYLAAGKSVLNAEYRSALYPGFCTPDKRTESSVPCLTSRRTAVRSNRAGHYDCSATPHRVIGQPIF
jgi:hypothetical protein